MCARCCFVSKYRESFFFFLFLFFKSVKVSPGGGRTRRILRKALGWVGKVYVSEALQHKGDISILGQKKG